MTLLTSKKPVTSSLRQVCLLKNDDLVKKMILKNDCCYLKNNAGRNSRGRLSFFSKGGGHKKRYRMISYDRESISGIVESIEYDPYRTANIARVYSESTNKHSYILAPEGLSKGHFVSSQIDRTSFNFKVGNLFYLKDLPLGVFVHNIYFPNSKKGLARSAGCAAVLISKNANFCRLRLNSGEQRLFSPKTYATLGSLSNPFHKRIVLGKAGRSRWLDRRPHVRGVAMNPIDHPHGGGQGKTAAGRPSVTPWGKLTKGQPTKKTPQHPSIVKKRK